MIHFNIIRGTPKSGKPLCATCKHAKIIRGQRNEEVTFCHLFSRYDGFGPVPFHVSECTEYHPINTPTRYDMEEIAWTIEARHRGPSGFSGSTNPEDIEVVITKPRREE